MSEKRRRFFSGATLEQALVAAASAFGMDPNEVAYRRVEKRHGFLKVRRNVLIEVNQEAPRKGDEGALQMEEVAAEAAAKETAPREPSASRRPSRSTTRGGRAERGEEPTAVEGESDVESDVEADVEAEAEEPAVVAFATEGRGSRGRRLRVAEAPADSEPEEEEESVQPEASAARQSRRRGRSGEASASGWENGGDVQEAGEIEGWAAGADELETDEDEAYPAYDQLYEEGEEEGEEDGDEGGDEDGMMAHFDADLEAETEIDDDAQVGRAAGPARGGATRGERGDRRSPGVRERGPGRRGADREAARPPAARSGRGRGETPRQETRQERDRGGWEPQRTSGRRGSGGGRRREREQEGRGRGRREEPRAVREEPREPEPPASPEVLKKAKPAMEYLLDLLDLDVDPKVEQGEGRLEVELFGPDAPVLVEEDGRALQALEHLMPRVLRGLAGESYPCRVDAENFHEIREGELRVLALRTASEVEREGRMRKLRPMAPGDRRIVHIALNDRAGVTTESEGDGYMKRVKIIPR